MKFIIAFACLLAVAYANEDANVLRSEAEVNVDSFKYALELDNSVNVHQQGEQQGEQWVVKGDQAWTSPEGVPVSIQYVADENGYQVLAANPPLPTPPPIPEAIQRALDWIAAHPPKE
ncbi:cuticular protein 47Eg [Drosophila pseudoobscura]|uniref:Cuticular protein 47Eg n=1 Tax=Drosophila pseudoobscura pseudoobscura TaxID=46245 RepID=A0A6I8UVG6_DROPS|nr:cuticular protein 47Eg [Drosophila pseudoobscura]